MDTDVNITGLAQAIAADTKRWLWLPDELAVPEDGKSYAPFYTDGAWSWSEVPPGAPPLDTFVDGWSSYGFTSVPSVFETGTVHCAVNFGSQTPTIGTTTFEASSGAIVNQFVPDPNGYSGTNWQLRRGTQAPTAPTIGNNTTQFRPGAFVDFPDPTKGDVAGVGVLCEDAIRRNAYISVSNLTSGNRYYVIFVFGSYPQPGTRNTWIEPDDGGPQTAFAIATEESILERGIRRYGFTAAGTEINFIKSGYDAAGSYLNALVCVDMGVA